MKLLVDGAWFGTTGIGRYAAEILARCPNDIETEILNRRRPASPTSPLSLWRAINPERHDAFWSPGFIPPAGSHIPTIVSVHDLIHRSQYGPHHRIYYDLALRPLLRRTNQVITVSQTSKRLIVAWSGIEPDRVVISSTGIDLGKFYPSDGEHSGGHPYFLYVGNNRPYKNLKRLMRGFAAARLPEQVRLLIAGTAAPDVLHLAKLLGVKSRVVILGAVPEGELPKFYRGATATLLPSLAEGFGLPVIESLACGTPVIASAACPSVSEFARDATIVVDPYSVASITGAIELAYDKPEGCKQLVAEGLRCVRHPALKWDNVATVVWNTIRLASQKCSRDRIDQPPINIVAG